jgi:hypothetical protein
MVAPGERERFRREDKDGTGREKPAGIFKAPVPQTDTGRQEEDSKANGRRVVKELGKLAP